MSTPGNSDGGQAAVALLGVIVCTKAFTVTARRIGWSTLAIGAALFIAGHVATRW